MNDLRDGNVYKWCYKNDAEYRRNNSSTAFGGRKMNVSELIEALQKMPQDAKVLTNGGYDPHFGALYNYVDKIEQENVGWDDVNNEVIAEVYIL